MKTASYVAVLAFSLAACVAARADVRDSATHLVLSLPAGGPAFSMPKGDWTIVREQRRPGGKGVYYLLASESSKLNLSVFIDKSAACSTAETCLQSALKNPMYREAKDLQVFDAAPFKAAQMWLDQPMGAAIKQTHVLAGAYVDGCWVDVHISKAGKELPDVQPLLELLSSLALQ